MAAFYRPAFIRDLRAEDADVINKHLPIIAARLATPATTPGQVTLIANEVGLSRNLS